MNFIFDPYKIEIPKDQQAKEPQKPSLLLEVSMLLRMGASEEEAREFVKKKALKEGGA